MCNAAIKSIITSVIALFLASCSSDNGEKEASELVAEAKEAVEARDYGRAKMLVDSINNAYPRAIKARREAMHVGTVAIEGISLRRLESADSLLALLAARADSLKPLVKYVQNPVEGYFVADGANPEDILNVTGIQARLSPEGDFYIVSTLKGKGVKSTSVTVTDGNSSATTATVSHDGERNDRTGGSERITFIAAECDTLGRFIMENAGIPLKLTFNGDAGSTTVTLPEKTAAQTATLYDYALTLRRARVASLEKERLTRALDTSRSQAARTFIEEESK
ncbi:MAG: hypothetical protein NC039_04090 [Muribaculaceae bacterium]|nr:hypothetical protein [Muribaculaceae bacterium]